jgi:predicted transcriptional regulator
MMADSTRVVFTVTSEMHQELSRLAAERGQSLAYILREAAAAYLERSQIRIIQVHPTKGGFREGAGRKPRID